MVETDKGLLKFTYVFQRRGFLRFNFWFHLSFELDSIKNFKQVRLEGSLGSDIVRRRSIRVVMGIVTV